MIFIEFLATGQLTSPAVGNNIDSTHSVTGPETESESLKPGDFVATVWDVEGDRKGWYLGMVEGVGAASDCVVCIERPHGFGSIGPYFDIRCLEPRSRSAEGYTFSPGFDNYHLSADC